MLQRGLPAYEGPSRKTWIAIRSSPMSASLFFSGLFTYDAEASSRRMPLDTVADSDGHIHGLLQFEISGKALPQLGFFGSDDVCFNTWIEELSRMLQTLAGASDAEYVFDEGEQGQPAFAFRRRSERLSVSVVDSLLSGAPGDPSYQNIGCSWSEFHAAVTAFLGSFHEVLLEECPTMGQEWWSRHALSGADNPDGVL